MALRYFSSRNLRLRWLVLWMVLAMAVLLGGLAFRQLVEAQVFQEQEDRQNLRRIVQPAPRGNILDIHGNVLAGNRPRFSAVVYLDELRREFNQERYRLNDEVWAAQENAREPDAPNWETTLWRSRRQVLQRYLDQIGAILGPQPAITEADVRQHFGRRLLMPFPLVADLSEADYAQLIEQLPLGSKVAILTETVRTYPQGPVAAHTVGYVVNELSPQLAGLPEDDLKTFAFQGIVGRSGLEAAFDETLQGRPGIEVCLVDRLEYRFRRVEELSRPPQRGASLITTLSLPVQTAAERALRGQTGAAVLLDVRTGEVRAMASLPSYDLNDFTPRLSFDASERITAEGAWLNRALQGLYPPGSTFKVVTAAAALRHGVVGPTESLYGGRFFEIGDRRFPEHSGASFGWVDVATMLERSSNVFCYQVGQSLGIDRLAEESVRFGLDQPTGIELPFETQRMRVPTREWFREHYGFPWRGGDTANVSIGQGDLRVTPLQMAAVAASLARGEARTQVTLRPRSPGEIVDHGGHALNLPPGGIEAIRVGMARATGSQGTARLVALPEVSVAAKTGTAQVQLATETLLLAWMIAYAPAENPEVALAVVVEGQTQADHYAGGRTAAPIARAMLRAYFDTFPSAGVRTASRSTTRLSPVAAQPGGILP